MFWQEKKEEDIVFAQIGKRKKTAHDLCEKKRGSGKWFVSAAISIVCIIGVIVFLSLDDDIVGGQEEQETMEKVNIPKNGTVFYPFTYNNSDAEESVELVPLTIKTKGNGYYYIKLKDSETEKEKLIFFVHGGKSVELDVPQGDYLLYYAHGDEWYGTSDLFGTDTTYSKADEVFDFHKDENGDLLGWTVELYLQRDGNLGVENIDSDDF